MSLSLHIDNKWKDILILGEGPAEGLGDTALAAETQYAINFTRPCIKFYLNMNYNGSNSFSFVNATKVYQFKARDALRLGNISGIFQLITWKKQD